MELDSYVESRGKKEFVQDFGVEHKGEREREREREYLKDLWKRHEVRDN